MAARGPSAWPSLILAPHTPFFSHGRRKTSSLCCLAAAPRSGSGLLLLQRRCCCMLTGSLESIFFAESVETPAVLVGGEPQTRKHVCREPCPFPPPLPARRGRYLSFRVWWFVMYLFGVVPARNECEYGLCSRLDFLARHRRCVCRDLCDL